MANAAGYTTAMHTMSTTTTDFPEDAVLCFPDDETAAAAFLVPRVGYEVAERLMYDAAAAGSRLSTLAARHTRHARPATA